MFSSGWGGGLLQTCGGWYLITSYGVLRCQPTLYSALVIILLWIILLTFLRSSTQWRSFQIVPVSFVAALAVSALLSIGLIEFFPQSFSRVYVAACMAALLGLFVFRWRIVQTSLMMIADYCGLADYAAVICVDRHQYSRLSINLKRLRRGLAGTACFAMACSAALKQEPSNFDSSTYNLGRIPLMVLKETVLLGETPNTRQSAYSLGHDLLFFPDIVMGNLRGLGLIDVLEWLMIMASLFSLVLVCSQYQKFNQRNQPLALELSLLITFCCFIASDLQVLQGLSTKNDLVVLGIFLLVLQLCLQQAHAITCLKSSELWLVVGFLCAYSINAKNYGFIVLIPAVVFGLLRFLSKPELIRTSPSKKSGLPNAWVLSFFGVICLLLLFVILVHSSHIQASISKEALQAVTTDWTNSRGDVLIRISFMMLNTSRSLIAFIAYPFSTLLKPGHIRPDDYLFSLGPLAPILNAPIALAPGSTFSLIRFVHEDYSFTSPLFHLLAINSAAWWLLRLARPLVKPSDLKAADGLRHGLDSPQLTIAASSLLAWLFFGSALLYQNWIPRFLGVTYIPIIVIFAVAVANMLVLLSQMTPAVSRSRLLLSGLVLGMILFSCFRFAWLVGLSSNDNNAYNEYTRKNFGYSSERTASFLASLASYQSQHLRLCYAGNTPVLVPLMRVLENPSFADAKIDILGSELCRAKLRSRPHHVRGEQQSAEIDRVGGIDYILFP